ncbi:hypothetical protein ACTFIW_000087 [Dictyostelium discoideum]
MKRFIFLITLVSILLLLFLSIDNTHSFQLDNKKKSKNKKSKQNPINKDFEEKSAYHHTDHIEDYHNEDHDKNIFDETIDLNNLNSTLKLWLESNNIGKFMDLHLTKKLHLTIPINFIFIGFGGEGNKGMDISMLQLVEWFQHIEHSLNNFITPIGEDYTTTDQMKTPNTHIEYNFEIQVSKTDPMVNTLVEDAIFWHLRSEASHYFESVSLPGDEKFEKRFYTNPHLLSSLLSSLSNHLELDKNSYTIYILNPNHPSNDGIENTDAIYGYRVGFSNQELKQLYRNSNLKIPNSLNQVHTDFEFAQLLQFDKAFEKKKSPTTAEGDQPIHINDNLKFRDHSAQSKEWADQMIKEFGEFKINSIQTNPNCQFGSPDTKEDRWICSTLELIYRENASIEARAQEILDRGTRYEQLYVYTAHENPIVENPMVDTWISHKRFAFIDLTAGPFEWGPSVGGNGLKTSTTLPKTPSLTQEQEEEVLQEEATYLSPDLETKQKQLTQELLLIETIYNNACIDQNSERTDEEKEMCEELITNINKIKKQLEKDQIKLQRKLQNNSNNNNNNNNNNVDNDEDIEIDLLTGNYKEVFGNQEQDLFISKLGSVLSSSLKHLITQPLPLFRVAYAKRVNFNVFVISDHQDFNARDYFNFNYEHFKYEIEKLRLPTQEFVFNIKSISMSDDKQLALAYYSSLKTVLNPTINDDHEFKSILNYYLDSKDIKNSLLKLFNNFDSNNNNNTNNGGGDDEDKENQVKYIPIFLFSISTNNSILIDKTHQAKSLSNMVIAIQTNVFSSNSTFTVNDNQLKYYPINPLSSILSATALNLGGLVGNHISYSEAHGAATSNWHWSVGDSPTSKTTTYPFTHFNEFQRDTIFRNYIASSLERSIGWVNKGVTILNDCKTSIKNFENALSVFPLEETVLKFQIIRSQWNEVASSIRDLDFSKSIKISLEAEKSSRSFFKDCENIQIFFMQSECQSDITQKLPKRTLAIIIICLLINILIISLLKTLYKGKNKLKIN